MRLRCRLAVIADGNRQEVILDIGIFHTRLGADEGGGFKMVCCTVAGFEEQPFRANPGF